MKPNRIILVLLCIVFGYFTLKSLAEKFGKFATKNEDERQTSYNNNQQTHATAHSNVVLLSMSGSGTKNTDRFYLNGNRCRIEYDFKGHHQDRGLLMVFLYKDGTDADKEIGSYLISQTESISNGVSYFYKPAGYYYLQIQCGGKYSLKVIQE
ncbi:MAG: hypothetical protein JST94_05655 [Bacteroidetes bacterium]|nr:hypothetical protein [Bacteroidota bacterium]MBS1670923.1 hypothetical protein [Bacteroidota bacterium]